MSVGVLDRYTRLELKSGCVLLTHAHFFVFLLLIFLAICVYRRYIPTHSCSVVAYTHNHWKIAIYKILDS